MKTRVLAGLAAMALATAAPAFPQTQTIEDYVRSLITDNVDPDEHLVGRIETRELEEGDETWLVYNLDPEKFYFVYGACDDDCADLDLVAEDANSEIIDSDEEGDDAPVLLILPGSAGNKLHIRATMSSCEEDVCVLAVGVYEQES